MNTMKIQLRDYQIEAINKINSIKTGSVLVCMATGLGKTVTFANIERRGRVLILAHRKELIEQPRKYYNCSYGVELNTTRSHGEEVVAASVQTLQGKRLQEFAQANKFNTVIIDEAHHATATSYLRILDALKPARVLGFTATPNRADGAGLVDVFDDIIVDLPITWAIEHGFLCDIHAEVVQCSFSLAGVKTIAGDFNQKQLGERLTTEQVLTQVVQVVQERAIGQTVVFTTTVEQARALAQLIPGSRFVCGATNKKEREQLLQDFSDKKFQVLCNCGVLTEGTDIPCIETIVLARPTKSSALYCQMVGRGLRLCPGKEKLHLIDCQGSSTGLSLCTPCDLLGVDRKAAKRAGLDPNKIKSLKKFKAETQTRSIELEKSAEKWLLEYREFDPFARPWSSSGIRFTERADGSLIEPVTSTIISAPDALGRVVLQDKHDSLHRFKTLDSALAYVKMDLATNHNNQRAIWSMSKQSQSKKHWTNDDATEAQLNFIYSLTGKNMRGNQLTKGEASAIISQALANKKNR